jgi:hypothetical protein
VQLRKRFPDGAVLVEWGKGTGEDVWFLNKLEELAAKMDCTPEKAENDSMVCSHEPMSSTILTDSDHCLRSSCNQDVRKAVSLVVVKWNCDAESAVQHDICSAVGCLHALVTIPSSRMQGVEVRISVLLTAITSCFRLKRLAVIIDDVWDLRQLDELGLLRDFKSSIMVTSREALPGKSLVYVGFKITREHNKVQEEAMLASYVAADPKVTTMQPHLKVPFQCIHCCHHVPRQKLPYAERGCAEQCITVHFWSVLQTRWKRSWMLLSGG